MTEDRGKMSMTFRLRLTLWYSALAMSIIILFSITVFGVLERVMRNQIDENINTVLDDVQENLTFWVTRNDDDEPLYYTPFYPDLRGVRTPGTFVQLWSADEPEFPVNLSGNYTLINEPFDPDALQKTREVRSDVEIDDTQLRVITRPLKSKKDGFIVGHLQAAMSLQTMNDATDLLLKIMVLGWGIGLLASVLLGDWIAKRTLRPITSITHTAEEIVVADDLSNRIDYDGPQDELGYLITTFNGMIRRLEKLFNSQQRFVADVSHELRTPITAIQSHLDLIERYGLKEDDPSLKAVRSEAQRMSRLVGDLLMLAQADLGHLPIIEGDVQLDVLVLEVFEQALVLSKGQVKVHLGNLDQAKVTGDSDRLKQLMLNLVTNGIKYSSEGGTITISLKTDQSFAHVHVADTGEGIPPEDLPNIFDRFYRVDKARARAQGGVGLGLSIAKWIAEAHHGDITVESVEGEGTTFTLHLPLKDAKPEPDFHAKETRQRFPALRLTRKED
jgi:two-component system OmpR family sensor kinase